MLRLYGAGVPGTVLAFFLFPDCTAAHDALALSERHVEPCLVPVVVTAPPCDGDGEEVWLDDDDRCLLVSCRLQRVPRDWEGPKEDGSCGGVDLRTLDVCKPE